MQQEFQLRLSEHERERLAARVEEDYRGALGDHERRMNRFQRYYRLWRSRADAPLAGEEQAANFRVPVLQWQVFSKWASELNSLFGDDAEIVAVPTGPSDAETAHKVGRYLTWRVFRSMGLANAFATFVFRKVLFGRAHAYAPWVRDTYKVRVAPGRDEERVAYEGPGFTPLWPDDLVVPAEDAETVQDFSFVIRKCRVTVQQLLDGEREGRYTGIRENLDALLRAATERRDRDFLGDEVKAEKDDAEGVTHEGSQAGRGTLLLLEWYGRWRLPKGNADVEPDDVAGRHADESELVVRYLIDRQQIVGVQDLADLYPGVRHRRPFVEGSLVKDGSYWNAGFGELLEAVEDEVTANHRLMTEAGRLSVAPVLFYQPGSGYNPDKHRVEPGVAYPCENPAAVQQIRMQADLNYCVVKEQATLGYGERVTGVSEQSLGRSIERPNAPRTASGQLALIEQGNVRASLDTMTLREDMRAIARHFWLLETEFSPAETFFRVTEEDAQGLFAVRAGGSTMTAEERQGSYDFDIRFATNVWSREAKKQQQLALYQIDLQNPLVVNNPRALWLVTQRLHRAMGDESFAELIPEPPDLDAPKPPREEWARMQQGEDGDVNPLDNDDLHLLDHQRRLMEAMRLPAARRDRDAEERMLRHIGQHEQQKGQKRLMQALAQGLVEQVSGIRGQGPGALPQGPGMGEPVAMPRPEVVPVGPRDPLMPPMPGPGAVEPGLGGVIGGEGS